MSYIKIWVHVIWATKYRCAIITSDLKYQLYDHIRNNANRKGIHVDYINGIEDHIHLLISLKGEQCISKVVFLLKGESSHWVNTNSLSKTKFEWQNEYMALSVSEGVLPRLRKYIRDQETHHKIKSFKEEYDIFIRKYGFNIFRAKANYQDRNSIPQSKDWG
jgi:REP element-mobilizing transposase RayT